jgi:hypothetical protein
MTREPLSGQLPSERKRSLLREVNMRIHEAARGLEAAPGPHLFICECGQRECSSTVEVEHDDFERVFSDHPLLVAPGHVAAV